jgi:hypothetical protein
MALGPIHHQSLEWCSNSFNHAIIKGQAEPTSASGGGVWGDTCRPRIGSWRGSSAWGPGDAARCSQHCRQRDPEHRKRRRPLGALRTLEDRPPSRKPTQPGKKIRGKRERKEGEAAPSLRRARPRATLPPLPPRPGQGPLPQLARRPSGAYPPPPPLGAGAFLRTLPAIPGGPRRGCPPACSAARRGRGLQMTGAPGTPFPRADGSGGGAGKPHRGETAARTGRASVSFLIGWTKAERVGSLASVRVRSGAI